MQEAVIEVPPTLDPLTAALTDALAGAAATAGSRELQVSGMLPRIWLAVSTTVALIVLEVPLAALMMVDQFAVLALPENQAVAGAAGTLVTVI